jgi:protein-S-isoprenylcysteine O-methyltransferase Ste14
VQLVRARKEEAVLEAAFGEEYVRYKAGTWF